MKIRIIFNKPFDEKVLSQFNLELLKEKFKAVYQLRNGITLHGKFKVGFTGSNLWIDSTEDEDVYCGFSMTDIKFFTVMEE